MDSILASLSDLFGVLVISAAFCVAWELAGIQVRKTRDAANGSANYETALGGLIFIGLCMILCVAFGLLAISAGAELNP